MTTAVLDHLWQSTLLALAAGLLVLGLRRASAAVRHGLWLAASLKFLVPFAALAALGRLFAPSLRLPLARPPEAALIDAAARPFSQAGLAGFPFAQAPALQAPLAPAQALPADHFAPPLDLVPVLLAIWALGCAVVLAGWAMRLARVRRIVRSAAPLGWSAPMPVLASPSLMEPGLVGLFRPVLVVPQTLPERLGRSEIDAILAHEAAHLRRRDNLTAAGHMLVEALFWFHPLVWWIGGRLIAEREQACDEAVVRQGHDRAAYARSLVESARLYLQSPLSCVAGASGADLKARVRAIMTAPPSCPLKPLTKGLMLAAGAVVIATPVAAGLLFTPDGRTAVSHAGAIVATAIGAPAAVPSSPAAEAAGAPIRLARSARLLPPAMAVARGDAEPIALAQTVDAPRPEAVQVQPGAQEAPPPVPASSITPAALIAGPPRPVERQAYDFVRAYAQASLDPMGRIARWGDPLCVHVVGLAPAQAALIRTRVEDVAKAVGAKVAGSGCRVASVAIAFTTDPQGLFDKAALARGLNTQDGPAVTAELVGRDSAQPVQALYRDVVADQRGAQVAAATPVYDDCNSRIACPLRTLFRTVLVVVDVTRVRAASPAAIADYVAMLALSQPRSLDRCQTMPSIADLFARDCPDRAAPTGLTAADAAYLTALYASNPEASLPRQQSDIAARMAGVLADARLAAAQGHPDQPRG